MQPSTVQLPDGRRFNLPNPPTPVHWWDRLLFRLVLPLLNKSTHPERWGSTDRQHFREAYTNRPFLFVLGGFSFLLVFLFLLQGLWALFSGYFAPALASVLLAVVAFAVWTTVHNWALMNPK